MNPFKEQKGYDAKPNRNNFDNSFQNHLTMKFGTLYPFACLPVVPGDSLELDTALGLKFMPMTFPVQSKMRSSVYWFYCRNKNLWKDWPDWLSGHRENLEHPYISQPNSFFKTGSIADYLGVPTTLATGTSINVTSNGYQHNLSTSMASSTPAMDVTTSLGSAHVYEPVLFHLLGSSSSPWRVFSVGAYTGSNFVLFNRIFSSPLSSPSIGLTSSVGTFSGTQSFIVLYSKSLSNLEHPEILDNQAIQYGSVPTLEVGCYIFSCTASSANVFTIPPSVFTAINNLVSAGYSFRLGFVSSNLPISYSPVAVGNAKELWPSDLYTTITNTEPVDTSIFGTPFSTAAGSNMEKISALPFRAYESIYNAFFRSTINDPFILNGEEQYNRYITDDSDGADTTNYHLFQRNWELDPYTSALPSPQQGAAPLVGMSSLSTMQITDEDGNIVNYNVTTADDGQTIVKLSASSPTATTGTERVAINIAQAGMSINDFRNVNAFQRFLETTIRKGYKYKDFISGHTGVTPTYQELDMPEYLGGFTRQVDVGQVTNVTDSGSSPLGSYAGVANCFAQGNSKIHHYCDDYGYVMGIVCVYPDPSYSQILPKHFLCHNPLDYYFPEFSNIGMVPITYEEMAPVQRYNEHLVDSDKKLTDVFGYQRPNYDLIYHVDEIHGNFRTDLRNFLINRIFSSSPELGHDFITIDSAQANQVFTVTSPDNDVIMGQIIVQNFSKRPIPRVSIPRLE